MARAKIWLRDDVHQDWRRVLRVGDDVTLNVAYSERLYVESWGGSTAVHGRLVGIEWHERTEEGYGPGVRVDTTDDFTHEPDYAYELTVATEDWLPHA
jgi:hypothetical protein